MKHSLINKKAVREFILEYAKRTKLRYNALGGQQGPRFTRVADTVFDEITTAVRDKCRAIVDRQPAKGKTVK